jgi:hypothetical protein
MNELTRKRDAAQAEIDELNAMMNMEPMPAAQPMQTARETRRAIRDLFNTEPQSDMRPRQVPHETREALHDLDNIGMAPRSNRLSNEQRFHRWNQQQNLQQREAQRPALDDIPLAAQRHAARSSYEQWRHNQDEQEQIRLVNRYIHSAIRRDAHGVEFVLMRFDGLNDVGLTHAFNIYRELLINHVRTLPADEYIIRFTLSNGQHGYHVILNGETHRLLVGRLINADRTFRENPTLRFFVSDETQDITIDMFDTILIERRPGRAREIGAEPPHGLLTRPVAAEVGGAELKSVYTGTNDGVREYIKRLEVGIEQGRLNCFVYALSMAGVDSVICNKMNARCHGRYLLPKHIVLLCGESGLNVEAKKWDSAYNGHIVVKPKAKQI